MVKNKRFNSNSLSVELNMNPQTVFRYLNGDNKLSLDFVERLLLHFPDVRAEWVMRGDGRMYHTEQEMAAPAQQVQPQAVAPTTDKDALIAALRETIAAKDALIASQTELIAELKKRCAILEGKPPNSAALHDNLAE